MIVALMRKECGAQGSTGATSAKTDGAQERVAYSINPSVPQRRADLPPAKILFRASSPCPSIRACHATQAMGRFDPASVFSPSMCDFPSFASFLTREGRWKRPSCSHRAEDPGIHSGLGALHPNRSEHRSDHEETAKQCR